METSARSVQPSRTGSLLRWAACALALACILAGCAKEERKKASPLPPRYENLPARDKVPAFMQGTVWEASEIQNNKPYQVSSYGLVVGLAGTGNNNGTPLAVRNHIIDQMVKHGFGSQVEGLKHLKPENMLRDPRTAIVEVYGYLPPGARAGQRMDVFVQAVTGSQTRSLAGGTLYLSDLRIRGVDPLYPKGSINVFAKAKGPVFVNPAYVKAEPGQDATRANLRSGILMNGGLIMEDRPIWIRLRTPQLSTARTIEKVIDQHYQDDKIARTQDEGVVFCFVPPQFNGDWEHFVGVVNHLYLNGSPGFLASKARELAAEALKPGALLQDMSWCWEGLGEPALEFIRPLYGNPSAELAYAAARAGAFIGDPAADDALMAMASTDQHPFQFNAVKVLGARQESVRVTRMLSTLLGNENAMVRLEAYRILAEWQAPIIASKEVGGRFVIDRIPSDGPALLYAARSGVPRIAIFGRETPLKMPMMFSALDSQLTISTAPEGPEGRRLVIFDRTMNAPAGGRQARSSADLHELIWRLGGGSDDGFAFTYSDLVGILKSMSDERCIAANFVLQDMPVMLDDIEDAPSIVEPSGRPTAAEAPLGVRPGEEPSRFIKSGVERK